MSHGNEAGLGNGADAGAGHGGRLRGAAAMTIRLGLDLMPLVEALTAVLEGEPNVVRQQQALELLIVQRALRMGNKRHARVVVDGVHKHARQILAQFENKLQ